MYRLATKRIAKNEVGNVVNTFMDSGWHGYRKGTARSATNDTLGTAAEPAEVCGLRTRPLADADPQQLLDPRTDSERIFLRTLRTRTDTDHNFSALILWTSLMKLVLRGGFRGGQCLITVQLPYNSA